MEHGGFERYDHEWWHYALRDEPYPDTYFDFPIL
jgi:D-alanyl-D-alanine dipeptidase